MFNFKRPTVRTAPPPPPPMPDVDRALGDVKEAYKALQRGLESWNKHQLLDALRSAQDFIDAAKSALNKDG